MTFESCLGKEEPLLFRLRFGLLKGFLRCQVCSLRAATGVNRYYPDEFTFAAELHALCSLSGVPPGHFPPLIGARGSQTRIVPLYPVGMTEKAVTHARTHYLLRSNGRTGHHSISLIK